MNIHKSQDHSFFSVPGVPSVPRQANLIHRRCEYDKGEGCLEHPARYSGVPGVPRDLKEYFASLDVPGIFREDSSGIMRTKPFQGTFNSLLYQDTWNTEKDSERALLQDPRMCAAVHEWLSIVVEEGHIEPSQPAVGRAVGWPVRPFSVDSLFIDFGWWYKQRYGVKVDDHDLALFSSILDQVFTRVEQKYDFPPLSVCRDRFAALKGEVEKIVGGLE